MSGTTNTAAKEASATGTRHGIQAYLVGGGIASLAAAAYLIRDGHLPGHNIHILEESQLGGSLDASGSAARSWSTAGMSQRTRRSATTWDRSWACSTWG